MVYSVFWKTGKISGKFRTQCEIKREISIYLYNKKLALTRNTELCVFISYLPFLQHLNFSPSSEATRFIFFKYCAKRRPYMQPFIYSRSTILVGSLVAGSFDILFPFKNQFSLVSTSWTSLLLILFIVLNVFNSPSQCFTCFKSLNLGLGSVPFFAVVLSRERWEQISF